MPTWRSSSTALAQRLAALSPSMEAEALGDLLADAHDRVEMARRILEDHADAPAAHLLHLLFAERCDVACRQGRRGRR